MERVRHSYFVRFDLKQSKVLQSTTSLRREFQEGIVLGKNEFWYIVDEAEIVRNLNLCCALVRLSAVMRWVDGRTTSPLTAC